MSSTAAIHAVPTSRWRNGALAISLAAVVVSCGGVSDNAESVTDISGGATSSTVTTGTSAPAGTATSATTSAPTTAAPTTRPQPTTTVPQVAVTVHSDIEVSLAVDTSISQALSFVNELVGTDTPAAVDVYVSTNGDYLVGEYGARAGAVDPMAAEVLGRSDTGIGYPGALFVNTSTANTGLIAHEYFHVVQHHLIGTTGNQGFAMPVWLSEAPAGIVTERSRLNPPVRFDAVEARRAVSEHPGEYTGMQAWEHSSGGFYADGNNYRTAAGLLSLYTEERGLTDSAWATDLWNAYAANGADWRAAWLQVYGAPAEEFYAWADMTVVALGAG